MKKFSIALLSIICSTQQIQSMENEKIKTITEKEYRDILSTSKNFNTTERFIDVTSIRWFTEGSFVLKQRVDLLNLKLYDLNLNEAEIKDLIDKGADPNYQEPALLYYRSNVVTYHARNETEQGLKNMKLFISLGISGIKNSHSPQTPLIVASNCDNTEMIKLLLPLEISDNSPEAGKDTYSKEQRKEIVRSYAFALRNVEIIKFLLNSKFITPNEALKEFVTRRKPNQEILNILREHNAICDSNTLNTVRKDAFPQDSWIQFLTEIVTLDNVQDDNSKTLTKLYAIQKMVNASVESLEKHKANQKK
jgi:hypothetical protein